MKPNTRQIIGLLIVIFSFLIGCSKTNDLVNDEPVDTENKKVRIKDIEGNEYDTIVIGTQVWLVQNLKTTKFNDGTIIPNVSDDKEWSELTTPALCNYSNLETNAAEYGRLYNWYAVNTGKLAPFGWRVPTDNDWLILENYLISNGNNWDGSIERNKIAKSLCSKTGWKSSDVPGSPGLFSTNNNNAGFSALSGGCRWGDGGFYGLGYGGNFWTSTEIMDNQANGRSLAYDAPDLIKTSGYKGGGLSVRLVRDN